MGNRSALLGLCVLAVVAVVLSGLALTRAHTVPQTLVATAPAPAPTPVPASTPTPTPPSGTVVFLGDGYTADSAWPGEVGKALGWQVVNLAASGAGYRSAPQNCQQAQPCTSFRNAASQVAGAQPTAVIIAGGEADGGSELKADVTATLEQLKQAVPRAEIVVLPPLSTRSTRPAWLTRNEQAIQEIAKAAGVTWVDTSSVTGNASAYRGGDLTDDASKKLAEIVAAELK